jgi:WhiB family redox-sensing transcriptional regulator
VVDLHPRETLHESPFSTAATVPSGSTTTKLDNDVEAAGCVGAGAAVSSGKGVPPVDWRHRSACLEEDPELFFPIGNTGPALAQIEDAKQVCRRCDVREQCLSWSLESGQDHGVWGGLSEDERRALKRRNARARVRTA